MLLNCNKNYSIILSKIIGYNETLNNRLSVLSLSLTLIICIKITNSN